MALRSQSIARLSIALGSLLAFAGATTATYAATNSLYTPPSFAQVFTDHAVLQRDQPLDVWGSGSPGQKINLKIDGQSYTSLVSPEGTWTVTLPSLPGGGPYSFELNDTLTKVSIKDIYFGDVFLCSGQSNMEFPVKYASNAWTELKSEVDPTVRFINVDKNASLTRSKDVTSQFGWTVAGGQASGEASAVCYYMAKAISKQQKVTVGIIDSDWGGTRIQAWLSRKALDKLGNYKDQVDLADTYLISPPKAQWKWASLNAKHLVPEEPNQAEAVSWTRASFSAADWKTMIPSGYLEQSGLSEFQNFDGVIWFRSSVGLTKHQAENATTLHLGHIRNADNTWVNGVPVGTSVDPNFSRDYTVPKGVLKSGNNIIVVRVSDYWTYGGFEEGPKARFLSFSDGSQKVLPDAWSYHISRQLPTTTRFPFAPWDKPNGITELYNAMIWPLEKLRLKGVVWYQGESNTYESQEYTRTLPALISDWRELFRDDKLPFLIVQISAFGTATTKPGESEWAELREAQRKVVNQDHKLGMTVTIDFGDRLDIHPAEKKVIGERLARSANIIVYNGLGEPSGPQPVRVIKHDTTIDVYFNDFGSGLQVYSSNYANAFEACTQAACSYVPALAYGDHVRLETGNTINIQKIRYAWADAPFVNLYNSDDVPVTPFEWDMSKVSAKSSSN